MENHVLTQDDIARYKIHLRSEEKKDSTIQNYLRDIHFFTLWLAGRPVTKELFVSWREHLLGEKFAPKTINAKISAVNSILRFLGWDECRVKALKLQQCVFRDSGRELSKEEYFRLLNAAGQAGLERLRLLIETVAATGIRVSELRYITVEAAQSREAVICLKGKVRKVFLTGKLVRKLLSYAKKRDIASGPIFRTRNGRCLDRGQIWREMKDLAAKAGVSPSKVFPHNLRHLFARVFYRSCRDIAKLADMLGHSSINTTRIYLMTTGAEHAKQLEKLGLIT